MSKIEAIQCYRPTKTIYTQILISQIISTKCFLMYWYHIGRGASGTLLGCAFQLVSGQTPTYVELEKTSHSLVYNPYSSIPSGELT